MALWHQMYDAERAQGEAATDPNFARHSDTWAGRATRYAATMRRQQQPDSFMQWLLPHLRPNDRVIDVGAGTGRYLPFLARQVAEVIAVEPSPAMRAELVQTLKAAEVKNVQVLADAWPLAQPLIADVVIAAHVVYGVRMIEPFIRAIDQAARRHCALLIGLQHPTAVLAPFWERIHGEARLPLPASLEALAVCHQLGLPARLDLVPNARSFRFVDLEDAMEEIRTRLRLSSEPTRDARLLAAMAELLVPNEDGSLCSREHQAFSGVVWWEPTADEL